MTTHATRPAVRAADLLAAASRLTGAVVLDLADLVVGPARYVQRLDAFEAIGDSGLDGDDDGTLVVLVRPGTARDLIDEHGGAGKAAQAITRDLRRAGVL